MFVCGHPKLLYMGRFITKEEKFEHKFDSESAFHLDFKLLTHEKFSWTRLLIFLSN